MKKPHRYRGTLPYPVLLPSPGLQSSQDRTFRIEVYNSAAPGRGGSVQRRYTRTDQRTGTRGPVRGLNLVPPGAHDGWMQGALTIAMPLRIGEEMERSRQASSAPALRVAVLSNQLCVVRCHRYLYRLRLTPWSDSIAQATEPNSVPGLDPGIGSDGGACGRSVGGIVHAYATRSGGSKRVQMGRDLSVNGKREGMANVLPMPHKTRTSKTQFLK